MTADPLVLMPPEPEVIHEGPVTIVGINDGERWELAIENCRVTVEQEPQPEFKCKGVLRLEASDG